MSVSRVRGSWGSLVLGVATLALAGGCRSAAPLVGGGEQPAHGTLSGTVSGPEGVAPVRGRLVEAVEVDTGASYSAVTSATGAYSIALRPGRYRLEVELADGEEVAERPGVVAVAEGELVTGEDFVLGGAGVIQ